MDLWRSGLLSLVTSDRAIPTGDRRRRRPETSTTGDGESSARHIAAHGRRLASYATLLGRTLGLSEADLATLHLGSLLHDIGKHMVPSDLLHKSGRLTDGEFDLVKQHTVVGDAMCASVPSLRAVRPIVRHHHERLDGSGYPDGLAGDQLPLLVQIVGIADVFDALVHARAYKPPFDRATACAILAIEAERGWRSSELVGAFVDLVCASRCMP